MPGGRSPRRAALAIAFALAGCTRALEPAKVEPAPVAPMDSIEVSLFLIGDAGSKAYDGEPVLKDLAKQSDSLRAVKQYVVFLGDNFIREGIARQVGIFRDGAMNAIMLLHRVPNPRELGVAVVQDGRIVELQEKPAVPKSDLGIVGIYLLDHNFFRAVEGLAPSARGELEITDALARLIQMGCDVRPQMVEGYWIDTGKHIDMLDANRLVLDTLDTALDGEVDAESRVEGRETSLSAHCPHTRLSRTLCIPAKSLLPFMRP